MFEIFVKVPLMILVVLAGVSYAHIAPAIHWPQVFQPFQEFLAKHAVGSLATAYLLGIIISALVGFWLLRKYPLKKPSLELSKSYFSFAFPTMITSVIVTLSTNIDKIMIGYFWTSTEVGYYYSVQQILLIILVINAAITTVLFPAFSKYHKDKNFLEINKITLKAERYISMIMIPIAVVLILFVNSIISIMLNSSFLPAASVLITLTLFAVITSFIGPYSALIGGLNRPGIAAKIGLVVCIINIVLNYFFIPQWGLLTPLGINGPTGAAIATLISTLVGLFGFKIMAKKLTGIPLLQRYTLYHIIAGLLMACVLVYLNSLIPAVRWYQLLVFAALGLVIYISVLFVLKEFKKQDFYFFLDIARPKEMLSYIKSELKEEK
jgi:O-antigen/teichoic acid export membrane protein